MQDTELQRKEECCSKQLIKREIYGENANLLYTWKDLLHFKGNYCTGLTDSYSLVAKGNEYNNNDVAQMPSN